MSAMATALFGSPLALQIYLIAHARKSDIQISNFGSPVASLSSNVERSSSEQESAKPNESAAVTPNTETLGPREAGTVVMPSTARKSMSVSYEAVGRGLYRRKITALEEAPEIQQATKVSDQEISAAADKSKSTPNLFVARKLQEIRQEPKRYALSAATATAISQSRNDRFRGIPECFGCPPASNGSNKITQLRAGQACNGRNMGLLGEERKNSAALVPLFTESSTCDCARKYDGEIRRSRQQT
ncbi:hypothetical protein AC578_4434 [Pseudocercospora eumusae]|uniref:Uncharacterized protein n=1 Tax=Pseudocercospora eumusae TaxID=321146 RepID=A0A139HEY6_9PEZI|nr:hypothetical protein AC578_4434 [Pseudocercospora eumusae]